ncbi:MAG: VOC family protein [Chrysiogenia bacterium]
MKINFITIHTLDMDRSVDFYRRVLGMQVSRRFSPRPGLEIVFMDGSGLQVEFIHDGKTPFSGSGVSLGFYVDNMEKTAAHLREQQVEILSGPSTMKNGVKLLQARDCNGMGLGFVQQL